ncbi:NAD(P)/FAD-dependent oxidoreductase [Shewanella marisflavi]|uniref:NAD(P)/FAD-dependent oxidoreductase n=1 Tax=Shewanella marisflavi TaxID=260364 RepID=UPI00200BE518|nr:NAD(P)/FAD-dependent oxidoreductase [Shewanella marisflavi]MCL1041520.1 NAD(P)/FAD-dependent oxidoreductase [Shewanella marisflavi]
MDKMDAVVVGAGVVGLAVAARLSQRFKRVLLVDRADAIGTGISSRNSEVIHAGIYYPTGSLKARLCVQGKHDLYAYCARRSIAVNPVGKVIVASHKAQEAKLDALLEQGRVNGVEDLEPLSRRQLAELEPALKAAGGLFSPSTGIIDSHGYMYSLLAEAEANGVIFAAHTEFMGASAHNNGFSIELVNDGLALQIDTHYLINSAGLYACELASKIEGLGSAFIPTLHWCKGHYFSYQGKSPFRHLIYPVPEPGLKGLGIHATLDLAGQLKFGPDTLYLPPSNVEEYAVPESLKATFYRAISAYFPQVELDRLQADYAGIRPKLQGPNDSQVSDFVIQGEAEHGLGGLVNLIGIESPGLTASLAIADQVSKRLPSL